LNLTFCYQYEKINYNNWTKKERNSVSIVGKTKSRNDICTTNLKQLLWQSLLLSSYWIKTIEKEKRRERIIKTHVSMRVRIIPKVVKK